MAWLPWLPALAHLTVAYALSAAIARLCIGLTQQGLQGLRPPAQGGEVSVAWTELARRAHALRAAYSACSALSLAFALFSAAFIGPASAVPVGVLALAVGLASY